MSFYESIDPFLMQLIILPIIVIGLGVLFAVITKKIFIGPLVTLFLNIFYELWHSNHYYPESDPNITSWNIILPIITLLISFLITYILKTESEV